MKKTLQYFLLATVLVLASYAVHFIYGETPLIEGQKWHVHDMDRPKPGVVTAGEFGGFANAPADATVLFDGRNLDQFRNKKLEIEDGAMIMGEGGQQSLESFGDMQLHVEWASPFPALHQGQNRGNSGVILMGLYEVQVLDSYQNNTYADGQAAALYGVQPPMVNASRPPGEWQGYDIFFRAPVFSTDGSLGSPARVTVVHNGVLVQLNQAFNGTTAWRRNGSYNAHEALLPLKLQWHDSPVRYRNIWIRPLDELSLGDKDGIMRLIEAQSNISINSAADG